MEGQGQILSSASEGAGELGWVLARAATISFLRRYIRDKNLLRMSPVHVFTWYAWMKHKRNGHTLENVFWSRGKGRKIIDEKLLIATGIQPDKPPDSVTHFGNGLVRYFLRTEIRLNWPVWANQSLPFCEIDLIWWCSFPEN